MSKEQIEDLMDYHKSPGDGWTWYSICSGHSPRADGSYHCPDTECSRCMTGSWANNKESAIDHELYVKDFAAWSEKHTTDNEI